MTKIIFAIASGIVLLGTGGLSWQKYVLAKTNISLQEKIEAKDKAIIALAEGKDTATYSRSVKALERAKGSRVLWSDVVETLFSLESDSVQFVNFSAKSDGNVSITGITTSINETANLIEKLKNNSQVSNPFLSSLSETSLGSETLLPIKTSNPTIVQFQLSFALVPPSK